MTIFLNAKGVFYNDFRLTISFVPSLYMIFVLEMGACISTTFSCKVEEMNELRKCITEKH